MVAVHDNDHDQLNNLLLQRDIQQQICKASLKLLNDSALTKSVRRKHKQSYEVAQQKLLEIGQGLSAVQQQQQQQQLLQKKPNHHHHHLENNNYSHGGGGGAGTTGAEQMLSQTLPLTVKTNFKVPQQQQQYSGESPLTSHPQQQLRRNRHDSYSNSHQHSPVSSTGGNFAVDQTKALYRSTSNSSSLNNANILGKSSLSLDHHAHLQHQMGYAPQQQQQHQPPGNKPMSYESKSLHNFTMSSSPNHTPTSLQSPHHHPALLSPTLYVHHNTSGYRTTPQQYSSGNLRQAHHQQQQQQFLSPPPQQVLVPQSGLGGYWTLNEHNERVWCASSVYSPQDPQQQQRHPTGGTTLDRKPAIYGSNPSNGNTNTVTHHGKMKMPSPETSPAGYNYQNNPGKSSFNVVSGFCLSYFFTNSSLLDFKLRKYF